MTQKKDRRSARTRKRESEKSPVVVPDYGASEHEEWCPSVIKILTEAGVPFSLYPLPSFPRSRSFSAPTVPEVSQ